MSRSSGSGKSGRIHSPAGGGGHAVVIGSGIAGLLAARVLASHFEQVTVVERDRLPAAREPRKGVPQGCMLHAMLPGGLRIMERLFPRYSRDVEAVGGVPLRMPADALILTPRGWTDRRANGWPMLSASRPLFEGMLRNRLCELPGLTILDRVPLRLPARSRVPVASLAHRPVARSQPGDQLRQ